jgi:hypothetical protein
MGPKSVSMVPFAAMYEDQFVAIRVAVIERHGRGAARHVELDVAVAQERHRQPLRIFQVGRFQPVQIEAMGPQFAFEAHPAGRRVRVIEMRALAVEAFAAVLFFEGPFRQADVGLRGDFAFFQRIHAPLPASMVAQALANWRAHLAGSRLQPAA